MVQAGVRKILNDVIDGDSTINYYNIDTVATMIPGALVIKSATDYDIKVCAGTVPIGWLGYGACNGNDKPADRDTIYLEDAEAPVHSKAHYVRAVMATGTGINKGDPLKPSTNGEVIAATVATDDIIAIAAESVGLAVTSIWVESRI